MKYCIIERTIAAACAATFLGFCIGACDSDEDNVLDSLSGSDRSKVEQAAGRFVDGTLRSVEKEREDGRNIYELKWETAGGAVIKLEFNRDDNCALLEAEDEDGPFDYEFTPGDPLITLGAALAAAQNVQAGEVQSWELDQDESDAIWQYEFELTDGNGDEWEVEINAADGSVLRVKES